MLFLLRAFAGPLSVAGTSGTIALFPGWLWKLAAFLSVLGAAALAARNPSALRSVNPLSPGALLLFSSGLLVLMASDFFERRFIFFASWTTAAEVLILGALFLPLFFASAKRRVQILESIFSPAGLLVVQIALAASFLRYADGRFVFSDDHPSFLYRLILLRDHFPSIPFYNLDWNLGYAGREFISTGALTVFFFTWPLVYFLGPLDSPQGAAAYNYILVFLFLGVLPWANYAAARMLQWRRTQAAVAGLFAVGPSLLHFEWLLKYGTLGFVLSAGLFPLGLVAGAEFLERRPHWRLTIALAVIAAGCSAWPVMAFAFVPLCVYALLRWPQFRDRSRAAHTLFLLALLFVYILLFAVPFFRNFQFGEFVASSSLPGTSAPERAVSRAGEFGGSLKRFQNGLATLNPLLLVLAVPGIFLVPRRPVRALLSVTALWLIFLALAAAPFKPQLELHRFTVPLFSLLSLLAGGGVVYALETFFGRERTGSGPERALSLSGAAISIVILGFLALTPLTVSNAYGGRAHHTFRFAPDLVASLSDAIKRFGGSGRTLFFGFILHDFGATDYGSQDGGHIAPIARFSGKELFAADYYHSRWTTADPVPASYRGRGQEGVEEFLDLINVTAVVTFKREWVKYCEENPRYRQVFQMGRFRLFERGGVPQTFVQSGRAQVWRVGNSALEVVPGTEDVVLKYRYLPSLRTDLPEAVLSGAPAYEEDAGEGRTRAVEFIRLRVPAEAVAEKRRIRISF